MSDIKRYDTTFMTYNGTDTGDYVLYTDHIAALEAVKARHVAYLVRGQSYVVYELDGDLREISKSIVQRHEIPALIADECDRFSPFSYREVKLDRQEGE